MQTDVDILDFSVNAARTNIKVIRSIKLNNKNV